MEEKIGIRYDLAKAIWASLEKKGIEPRKDGVGILSCRFTREELDQVTSLVLENVTSLEGISNLRNLRNLSVTCTQSPAFTPPDMLKGIKQKDIFEIEKLGNLEHLTIKNQPLISSIDISGFPKLSSLTLARNENLEEIVGLSENRTIYDLALYGQNSISSIDGLDTFIEQNPNLSTLQLDVLLYPSAIGYSTRTGKHNEKALGRISTDLMSCKWSEAVLDRTIDINNHQMSKLHESAKQITSQITSQNSPDIVTITAVNRWLAENVTYNHDALDSNLRGYTKNGILSGPIKGANGAYDAIMFKHCVCEGYTRAMQYMLGLKGIKTANTLCVSGKDSYGMADKVDANSFRMYKLPTDNFHSICRIERDSGCYYCDACWDATAWQKRGDKSMPNLLQTKQQISETHSLSFYEQNVSKQNPIPDHVIREAKSVVEQTFSSLEDDKQM